MEIIIIILLIGIALFFTILFSIKKAVEEVNKHKN